MSKLLSFLVQCVLWSAISAQSSQANISQNVFSPLIEAKLRNLARRQPQPIAYPQVTSRTTGEWILIQPNAWTSGFLPASLYAMHERVQLCRGSQEIDQDWIQLGRGWSTGLIPLTKKNNVGHDVGFLSMPFVKELAVNRNNRTAIAAIKSFGTLLGNRFSNNVGCTRSWESPAGSDDFKVIIDNMMNIELLFVAGQLSKNATMSDMAISHADHTMKNHIRADGSTYHLVIYSQSSGNVTFQGTHQGYSDSSTWTRGQAWAIYGFSNMYARTKFSRYLTTARQLANYYISRLPSNAILPWDFDAPQPTTMDSSAMSIAARGLLLLSKYETDRDLATKWTNAAITLLNTVTDVAWYPSWQSILANGTANNPAKPPSNSTGLIYGDYYFVDAGNELLRMGLARC